MNLTVDLRAETLLARIAGAGDRLSQNMLRVVTRLSIEVQGAVKDKLTGKVLHVRTGTLRRSINRVVKQDGNSTEATVGTNVKYAGVHEFGFNGEVTVRAHTRKIPHPAASKLGRKSTGSGGVANVRSYSRKMVMPERSFLRSTLTEFSPRIRSELKAAALEAIL